MGTAGTGAARQQEADSAQQVQPGKDQKGVDVVALGVVHPASEGRGNQQQCVHRHRGQPQNLAEGRRTEILPPDGYGQRVPAAEPYAEKHGEEKKHGQCIGEDQDHDAHSACIQVKNARVSRFDARSPT